MRSKTSLNFILIRVPGKVVSPIKVILTPSKEENEKPQDKVLTLDSEEEEPAIEKTPAMWVRELLLTEQPDEYDSEDDPEFVPPSIIYETDKEYDEVSLVSLLPTCVVTFVIS